MWLDFYLLEKISRVFFLQLFTKTESRWEYCKKTVVFRQ